jgi:NAD(P)-dependent dehydrogenase (short-subunit alcohol dehydrogenase family)
MKSLAQLTDLSGRSVFLTGGAGAIALAAAETLIEQGARIALTDVDAEACSERARHLGKQALPFPCDLADEAATRFALQEAIQQLGGLDILIHCAAFVGTTKMPGWAVPFDEQSVAAWDAAMRVNLTAAFVLAQEARSALTASKRGSIILFSSIYGMAGPDLSLYEGTTMGNPAGYGASKGGLLQLGRYLATIFAPHIRVNAISPGGIWRGQPEQFVERYQRRAPLQRMGTEEDLKGAIAYLASDLSAYVTGHNLVVDGGWTAW